MEDVDREVYFEDVRLQMDAKLWGEEYNRHKPPKKVCVYLNFFHSFRRISLEATYYISCFQVSLLNHYYFFHKS